MRKITRQLEDTRFLIENSIKELALIEGGALKKSKKEMDKMCRYVFSAMDYCDLFLEKKNVISDFDREELCKQKALSIDFYDRVSKVNTKMIIESLMNNVKKMGGVS
jgi:hypothetical protein